MLTIADPVLCVLSLGIPLALGLVLVLPLRLGRIRSILMQRPMRRVALLGILSIVLFSVSYSAAVRAFAQSAYFAALCEVNCDAAPEPEMWALAARYALPPPWRAPCAQQDSLCRTIEHRLVFADGSVYADWQAYLLVLGCSLIPPAMTIWLAIVLTRPG